MQDKDLFIKEINEKNAVAFHRLFEMFYKSLVNFSSRYVVNLHEAEDIVQNVFIRIWESPMLFRNYNEFRSLLYTSTYNASINFLKHKEVQNKYISHSLLSNEVQEGVDLQIMKDELYRLLFQYVEKLPPKRKEIFKLYLQGKKNSEIAILLGVSEETVKTAKKESVRYLRKNAGKLFFLFCIFKLI